MNDASAYIHLKLYNEQATHSELKCSVDTQKWHLSAVMSVNFQTVNPNGDPQLFKNITDSFCFSAQSKECFLCRTEVGSGCSYLGPDCVYSHWAAEELDKCL